jgi:hypothetical protein
VLGRELQYRSARAVTPWRALTCGAEGNERRFLASFLQRYMIRNFGALGNGVGDKGAAGSNPWEDLSFVGPGHRGDRRGQGRHASASIVRGKISAARLAPRPPS